MSSYNDHLYGIDKSSLTASFVEIENNSINYNRLLSLGRATFPGPSNAMKNFNNENYIVTYNTYDYYAVPHYFILTIDLKNKDKIKIKSNVSINGPGIASFFQISDDIKQIVGIRQSFASGASLEVVTINQTNGQVKTVGLYPYGSYSLIMTFAQQRWIYYNIINSRLYAINIDTGKLDINIIIPNDYSIYDIVYDQIKDRLLSIVYSSTVVEKAWFISNIIIHQNSSTMKFERIGKSIIPMEGKLFWSTTYTLALKQRQWITLWSDSDEKDNSLLINFHIDTGDIIQKENIKNSKYLNNIVYFH